MLIILTINVIQYYDSGWINVLYIEYIILQVNKVEVFIDIPTGLGSWLARWGGKGSIAV